MTTVLDFSAARANGEDTELSEFGGKVLLIVNTASKCVVTPQYEGLESLQKSYGERGFSVLAFPCNQFGGQEPGSEAEEYTNVSYFKVKDMREALKKVWGLQRIQKELILIQTK